MLLKFPSVLRNSGKREEWIRQFQRENKENPHKKQVTVAECEVYRERTVTHNFQELKVVHEQKVSRIRR